MVFWGNEHLLWTAVFGVVIMTILLIRVGIAHFQREYLLGREVDSMNLKWIWRTFRESFVGTARTPIEWYQVQIRASLRKMKAPLLLLTAFTIFGSIAAYQYTSSIIPSEFAEYTEEERADALDKFQIAAGLPSDETEITFGFVFLHNLQAVFVMFFFGLLSFGVLGVLAFFINIGVIGGLFALLESLGLPAATFFLAGILPHGIFEIPAIIFAAAGIFYFGAVMVTPNPSKTMGEVFIGAISDWFKIGVGIVLPLLFIAALIETGITPKILIYFTQ